MNASRPLQQQVQSGRQINVLECTVSAPGMPIRLIQDTLTLALQSWHDRRFLHATLVTEPRSFASLLSVSVRQIRVEVGHQRVHHPLPKVQISLSKMGTRWFRIREKCDRGAAHG